MDSDEEYPHDERRGRSKESRSSAASKSGKDEKSEMGMEVLHEDEVDLKKPLKGTGDEEEEDEEEGEQLLEDTFSFIMTADYPKRSLTLIYKYLFCGWCWGPCVARLCCCCCYDSATDEDGEDKELTKEEKMEGGDDEDDDTKSFVPFWLGISVFFCQMFIYTVVVSNLLFNSEIPPNADRWLRFAQVFAVIVTIYTQSDLIDGIFLATEGSEKFSMICEPIMFRFSVYLRVFAGTIGIIAVFMLIIYSTEVVELLLNFTAMEFVATLDGSAFEIASKGFLGSVLAKKTASLSEFRYTPNKRGAVSRTQWYVVGVLVVFSAFATVWAMQTGRRFGDNEVYVQFDDADSQELFGISGAYQGCNLGRIEGSGPLVYIPVSNECTGTGFPAYAFYYCYNVDGWVYTRTEPSDICNPNIYVLRSSKGDDEVSDSDAYDLTTHNEANWIVRRSEYGGEVILENFFLQGIDKYTNSFLTCDKLESRGVGDSVLTFEALSFEDGFPWFDEGEGQSYYGDFGLMYRPIFQRPIDGQNGKFQVILYFGLRWLYVDLDPVAFATFTSQNPFYTGASDISCGDAETDPSCWRPFAKHFQSSDIWLYDSSVVNVTAMSDPMMLLSGSDTGYPTSDLQWYETQIVRKQIVSLQPTTPLPATGQNETSSNDEYFFQCRVREEPICGQNDTGISLLFTSDSYADESSMLAFLGQGIEDMATMATIEYRGVSEGHTNISDVSEGVLIDVQFKDFEARHDLSTCAPIDGCVQVVVLDSFEDGLLPPGGYEVFYGSDLEVFFYAEEPTLLVDFRWSCRLYQVGNCENKDRPSPTDCDFAQVIETYYPGGFDEWFSHRCGDILSC